MVDQNAIASWIKNPSALNASAASELEEAIRLKPWCASYRVLLAKAHKNENSFLQNKQLKLASIYTGDREKLFYFMEGMVPAQVGGLMEEEAPVAEELPTIKPKVDVKSEVDEESVSIEEMPNDEHLQSDREINFDDYIKYDPIEELTAKSEVETDDKEEEIQLPADFVAYNPEVELQRFTTDKEENQDHDFFYWLNNTDSDITQEQEGKKPTQAEELQSKLSEFLSKKSSPKQKQNFYNAEEKAIESEKDKSDIVSETLVKIYIAQEYYDKAIEGYQKLSLQNPSKSAYFAARIQEVKESQKESKK